MSYQRTMRRRSVSGGAAWAVVLLAGVFAGGRVDAQCEPEQTAKLTASDGASDDWFGSSVSIGGDVAVVGARQDDDFKGSANVFRHDGAAWVQEQKLTASDGAAVDWFGFSVAISGDVAVVGAFRDDDNGTESGSAYVFDLNCPSDCPADLDDSGAVDFGDILAILSAWGNKGGPEDLDGSGVVDFGDILVVLEAWGPCPE